MISEHERVVAEIGRRVAGLRVEQGLTQPELAAAAGIPVSGLGVVERGGRPANVLRLWRIASALGVTLAELLQDVGADPPGA